MQEAKHTNGPYSYGEDNDGWYLESLSAKEKLGHGDQIAYCLSEDDARRISACLNACNGLPDEALDGGWTAKGMIGHAKSLERKIEALKASNAELLEALKAISGGQVMREKELGYTHADVVVEYQRIASAAIANAKSND